jgi:glycine cleavage system H protein
MANGGAVAVGTDEFAANFAGELAAVELPAVGSTRRQGDPAWTLVSKGGRRLAQVMPLEGQIVEVNHALLEDPSPAGSAPYDRGWIARIRPMHLASSARNLIGEGAARTWLDATRARVTSRLGPLADATAADGGEWAGGFGDHLDDVTWEGLKRELFPSIDPSPRADA